MRSRSQSVSRIRGTGLRSQRRQLNRGSISVALATMITVAIPVFSAIIGIVGGLLVQQRLNWVADSAALAASDIQRGLTVGNPCDIADEIAVSASATLETCRIVSDCVLVEIAANHVFWVIRAAALAGPP